MKKQLLIGMLIGSASMVGTNCYAMLGMENKSGSLEIHNQSSFTLSKITQSSHQMAQWNFPDEINARGYSNIPIEFDWGMFTNVANDDAVVDYQINCGEGQLEKISIVAKVYALGVDDKFYEIPYLTAYQSGADCVLMRTNNLVGNGDLGFAQHASVELKLMDKTETISNVNNSYCLNKVFCANNVFNY